MNFINHIFIFICLIIIIYIFYIIYNKKIYENFNIVDFINNKPLINNKRIQRKKIRLFSDPEYNDDINTNNDFINNKNEQTNININADINTDLNTDLNTDINADINRNNDINNNQTEKSIIRDPEYIIDNDNNNENITNTVYNSIINDNNINGNNNNFNNELNNNNDDDDDDNDDVFDIKNENEENELIVNNESENMKITNEIGNIINNSETLIDIIISSNSGSSFFAISNNKNLLLISKNNGIKWTWKLLPTLNNGNKWSKLFIIEPRKDKYNLILMGEYGNIYLSTFDNLGDNWVLISNYKGNNVIYSDNYKYIYISTNNGILMNYNESDDLIFDTSGCINNCYDNYNSYNGIYKFKELNDFNIKNKNIRTIACTPDGNILIIQIENGKLLTAKIRKFKEYTDSENIWKNKYEYKTPDDDLETELDDNGNILWNINILNNKSYNFNSIIVQEQNNNKDAIIFLANNKNLYYIKYNKEKSNKLENKTNLSNFKYTDSSSTIENLFKNNIYISNLLQYNIGGYLKCMYFMINFISQNIFVLYNLNNKGKQYKKIELNKNELINYKNKNFSIKNFSINKNGSQAIILSNIGHIYINKNLNDFYNDKSNFERLLINLN